MKKHKIIKDFQFTTQDKKIFTLKAGIYLEDYKYVNKNDSIKVDKDIVDNNPEYFSLIDWRMELQSYLRSNKIPQPGQLAKKIIPFIENMILNKPVVEKNISNKNNSIKEKELDIREKIIEQKELELKEDLKFLNSQFLIMNTKEEKLKLKEIELNQKEHNLKKKG